MTRRNFLISAAVLPLATLTPFKARAATGNIHLIEGTVLRNRKRITSQSMIQSNDEIVVSSNGQLVFSMG